MSRENEYYSDSNRSDDFRDSIVSLVDLHVASTDKETWNSMLGPVIEFLWTKSEVTEKICEMFSIGFYGERRP